MADISYRHNRDTGLVEPFIGPDYGPGIPFSALTNGRVGLAGNNLVNMENHQIIQPLGHQGETFFVQMNNGNILVHTGILQSQLNAPTSRSGQYGVAGQITVKSAVGDVYALNIDFASVSEIGKRLAIDMSADPNEQYTMVDKRFTSNQQLQQAGYSDLRLATATEAKDYAIMGYLRTHYERQIEKIKEDGGLEGQSNNDTSFSGILLAIAQVVGSNLTFHHDLVLRLTGDISIG